MLTESSERAIAAVLKPIALIFSISRGQSAGVSPIFVQGTCRTVPILTRRARLHNGSQQVGVVRTASTPRAAAERNIAPILVESAMASSTAILRAFLHIFSTVLSFLRFIAHKAPRVNSNPVSLARTSRSAVYMGKSGEISSHFFIIFSTAPPSRRSSVRSDTGSYPELSATSITVGLSAMNTAFSGSSLFRSCAPVSLTNTSSSGISRFSIFIISGISFS